jgi:hypothetical protein
MVYTIINEEMCKLPNGPDPSKIFVGGLSMGSLLTTAAQMRQHEFLPSPLGGVFGFIGFVPTLPQNLDQYQAGPGSDYPAMSQEQLNFVQNTYAYYMYGNKDPIYLNNINGASY